MIFTLVKTRFFSLLLHWNFQNHVFSAPFTQGSYLIERNPYLTNP